MGGSLVLAYSGYAWLNIVQALAVLAETPSPLGLRVALAEAHHHVPKHTTTLRPGHTNPTIAKSQLKL
jgi:hypothetical protein